MPEGLLGIDAEFAAMVAVAADRSRLDAEWHSWWRLGFKAIGQHLAEELRPAQQVALERVEGWIELSSGLRVIEAHHLP